MFYMVKNTTRDRVWTEVLIKTYRKEEPVDPGSLSDTLDVSLRTAQDTMRTMERAGFIQQKTSRGGKRYYVKPVGGLD